MVVTLFKSPHRPVYLLYPMYHMLLHITLIVRGLDNPRHSKSMPQLLMLRFLAHQFITLQWWHNERNGVSNRQHHDCLFDRLFRHKSKKTSKLRVTGLCVGNSPVTGEFPHKGPVTRKMCPFDDVIMSCHVIDVNFVHPSLSRKNILTTFDLSAWGIMQNANAYIHNSSKNFSSSRV